MKLKNAAQATAYCGRSTRVETMVAMELAASCKPLRKSNASATVISPTRTGKDSDGVHRHRTPKALDVLDDNAVHDSLATSSKRSTTFSR